MPTPDIFILYGLGIFLFFYGCKAANAMAMSSHPVLFLQLDYSALVNIQCFGNLIGGMVLTIGLSEQLLFYFGLGFFQRHDIRTHNSMVHAFIFAQNAGKIRSGNFIRFYIYICVRLYVRAPVYFPANHAVSKAERYPYERFSFSRIFC